MHSDRGLFAAAGIVFAFSMLWTMAILIPDKSASARPMGFVAGDVSDGIIVHAEYPRIVKSKNRASTRFRSAQTSMRSRTLVESSDAQTQPTATASQPTYTISQSHEQKHEPKSRRLFPAYVWYLTALFLYKTRNYVKKRNKRELEYADESFFQKSGLESSLEYGQYGLEYEDDPDDFMSVNSSFNSNYGSSSRWTPDTNNKFDLEDSGFEYELTDTII